MTKWMHRIFVLNCWHFCSIGPTWQWYVIDVMLCQSSQRHITRRHFQLNAIVCWQKSIKAISNPKDLFLAITGRSDLSPLSRIFKGEIIANITSFLCYGQYFHDIECEVLIPQHRQNWIWQSYLKTILRGDNEAQLVHDEATWDKAYELRRVTSVTNEAGSPSITR